MKQVFYEALGVENFESNQDEFERQSDEFWGKRLKFASTIIFFTSLYYVIDYIKIITKFRENEYMM